MCFKAPFKLWFVLMILTASCSSKITKPLESTIQTEGLHHKWKVGQMQGVQAVQGDVYIDLRDIHNTTASAGCEILSFTPKYSHNNRVEMMHMGVKALQCKGATTEDRALAENLKSAHYFNLQGDRLQLLDAHRLQLVAATIHPEDEHGTINRDWAIISMINTKSAQLELLKPGLHFKDLTNATAKLGCNTFKMEVLVTGKYNMAIKDLGSTRMFCKDAATVEEVFSKTIPLVRMYQVIGNRLKLFDIDGVLLLEADER